MQRGTIKRQDDGKWKARYRLGGRGSASRSRTFDRKADAQAWLSDSLAKLAGGVVTDPGAARRTFTVASEDWVAARLHVRESTRLIDRQLLDTHILPTFGDLPLNAITANRVRGWVQGLQVKGLSANTIRLTHRIVSGVLGAAVDDGALARNVARGTKLPKPGKMRMKVVTLKELHGLVNAAPERYQAMIYVAGTTGLRFAEVAGLTVDQLHLLERPARLRVTQQLARVGGEWVVTEPKTAASVRSVALPSSTVEALAAHMAKYPPVDGFIFTTPAGTPLNASNFRTRMWGPLTRSLGHDGLRFHDLRHSHAAHLIQQNQHPKLIQERMGHASIRVTLDTYGHLMPGMDTHAVDVLDDAIRAADAAEPDPAAIGSIS